jgi:hypothetical protein
MNIAQMGFFPIGKGFGFDLSMLGVLKYFFATLKNGGNLLERGFISDKLI